jgi:hypothetical protein
MDLFRVRRKIKYNMTQSGTHESDPWHFVENALLGTPGLNKISAYYFYQRCKAKYDIDSNLQPFLDPAMKGDSVCDWGDNDDDKSPATFRARKGDRANEAESATAAIMKGMFDQAGTLIHHFEASEKLNKEQFEASEKSSKEQFEASEKSKTKQAAFSARLEIAKALGDKDELKK